ncbi:MAG: tRNA (N(6)-L-threonylcarbamoyladenosine(37)-C(2))-methylthiotransferase MtaB [Bacteroidetes bacterium]|nr:tRNA (N(6)-L-threonylcarbamoyladenosine(37)-C(2))-methylthiotransferase MtaB [Bacteroidota bacterium]
MAQSVAFYTLGCKLNFAETGTISRQLLEAGLEKAEFTDGADLYVINTCSVTEQADKKCRKVVQEALRFNPNAYVVVVGCYAQLKPREIAGIPGVDMVLGAAEKFNLVSHLGSLAKESKTRIHQSQVKEVYDFVPSFSKGERTRTFLKVQDGCDYFCSFCTIPLARGKSRSANVQDTLRHVMDAAAPGVREIILSGVNLGDFGVNHDASFYDLIKELDAAVPVDRFRISSIEPNLLEDRIIELVAGSKKFVPHFHVPLQSGSDYLLKRMRRRYDRALYTDRIMRIKELMPHACIGVDVIVGFPGEDDACFLDTYQYLNELPVSYLHVFPYSERVNTTAIKMKEVVPRQLRLQRSEMLRILSEKKRQAFYRDHIGTTREVLFEAEEKNGMMEGFTDNYIKVRVPYDPLLVNEVVATELGEPATDGVLQGLTMPFAVMRNN